MRLTEDEPFLQPGLEDSRYYNTCIPYNVYSVARQLDRRVLRDEDVCGDDGKTIRNVDLFPNEKYGFNRLHLRVATFEVKFSVRCSPAFRVELKDDMYV